MSDLTERAVTARVPSVTDERLKVLSRREPVTVKPGTSLADCIAAIQRTGTGDSVFVTNPDGSLAGSSRSATSSAGSLAATSILPSR